MSRTLHQSRNSTQVNRISSSYLLPFFFRQEIEKSRIDVQAIEVQNYLRQEIQRKEDIHRTELTHQQEK